MVKVVKFSQVHHGGAGIDIGSREIFVSIDGCSAVKFDTFTSSYHACCKYLVDSGICQVAMEATGVYWLCLYSMLEDYGIRVCLVNPREVQQVKARKSDVQDCQWIQQLFVAGLLRESIIPEGLLKELRFLIRERADLIQISSMYINKMQRALELMNIKLRETISQIQGVSGLKVIRAILSGERDPEVLLSLCHSSIRQKKAPQVRKAVEGNYNPYYLYMLEISLHLWEEHERLIKEVESKIEELLDKLNEPTRQVPVISKSKPTRHHHPCINELHTKMVQLYAGVDLTDIAGINDVTLLRLYAEVGTDISRFPTSKHFVSWLGLSPAHKQSGKMKRRIKGNSSNKAGMIFRQSAQSLVQSKHNAIGVFIGRIRNKKGSRIAIKAGARKIAQAYYLALTKGINYVEQGAEKYLEQQKQREIYMMKKLAKKHSYNIV
ncbi:MAG: IS110 family transposase, partial [Eubacterium sp.]|nr:IS110 family transposase [Eubacterium sp.]